MSFRKFEALLMFLIIQSISQTTKQDISNQTVEFKYGKEPHKKIALEHKGKNRRTQLM